MRRYCVNLSDEAAKVWFAHQAKTGLKRDPALDALLLEFGGLYELPALYPVALNADGSNLFYCSVPIIDKGMHITSARIVKRIRYCNSHHDGYETNVGVKDFIIQGTNNAAAFANLTYADDTNWTTIATDVSTMVQHTEGYDGVIWNTINLTNDTAYKYYAVNYPRLKSWACS